MLKILLADDHEVVRKGIRHIFSGLPQWQVCGESSNASDVVRMVTRLQPDVAIIEVAMSGLNGSEAITGIKCACPHTEVLIFSMQEDEESIQRSAEAGALGYVLKSESSTCLIEAVESVSHHKPYFRTTVSGIFPYHPRATLKASLPSLTRRELEIIQILAEGKGNREIAAALRISVKTVETHRAIIKRKLGMGSIVDLVHYAVRNKLVQP